MNHLGYSAIIHPSPNRSANSAAIRRPRQCATREAGDYYGRMRQALGNGHSGVWKHGMAVSWNKVKKQENRGNFCDFESQNSWTQRGKPSGLSVMCPGCPGFPAFLHYSSLQSSPASRRRYVRFPRRPLRQKPPAPPSTPRGRLPGLSCHPWAPRPRSNLVPVRGCDVPFLLGYSWRFPE